VRRAVSAGRIVPQVPGHCWPASQSRFGKGTAGSAAPNQFHIDIPGYDWAKEHAQT
jgi:hypothetical protein